MVALIAIVMAYQTAAPSVVLQREELRLADTTTSSVSIAAVGSPADTTRRPRAVEYSDWYGRRLTVHRWASYAELPLFAAQYAVGERLLQGKGNLRLNGVHGALAGGTAVLFGLNTLTGGWNLWDSRADPAGRTRRILHTALMLTGDAGFVWTGASAPDEETIGGVNTLARRHKQVAIGSMAVSTLGTLMMWFWKD